MTVLHVRKRFNDAVSRFAEWRARMAVNDPPITLGNGNPPTTGTSLLHVHACADEASINPY